MDVALKIWRFDPDSGERVLKRYEVEAPEWACLLDVLDIVKDQVDGSLAYRKSCRMMICGSCGMRMDGRAVLACKERMKPIVDRGHVPVISAMGNMPVLKDLVVDMSPFWTKIKNMKPWIETGYEEIPEKEFIHSQEEMNPIHKEALCIMCGCCVSECNSMESDPEFFGPAALAKGFRFVGDPRDRTKVERLEDYNDEHGIWDCTRCYFCNERCPKGVDPRDAIAKLGAESIAQGIDRDMGAKHANWFVHSARTTGWPMMPSTASLPTRSVRNRSGGTPASRRSRSMASAQPGTLDACLSTTALPAMSAGAAKRKTCQNGKFHGMTARTTPSGLNATKLRRASVSTISGSRKRGPFCA